MIFLFLQLIIFIGCKSWCNKMSMFIKKKIPIQMMQVMLALKTQNISLLSALSRIPIETYDLILGAADQSQFLFISGSKNILFPFDCMQPKANIVSYQVIPSKSIRKPNNPQMPFSTRKLNIRHPSFSCVFAAA